jgi:FkbM family methyltransferase
MKAIINKIIKRSKDVLDYRYTRKSFSQFGEDLIIEHALNNINEKNISYLDIGANHPCFINNSYYFYKKGFTGTLIEPDPSLYKILKKKRPLDNILNCGVSFAGKIQTSKLYIMSNSVLNTFSLKEAKKIEEKTNFKIEKEIDIELIPINYILKEFKILPSFISIDVEGLDYEILESFDFEKYRPALLIIETLTYDPEIGGVKIKKIIELMINRNYIVFADTRLNTIFIDKNRMQLK